MIGIVVVSHSPALATAAVSLALEMAGDAPPRIAIAAGADESATGTDAVKVAAAIDEVASASADEGVLVFMDLGSAVLSAKMALEFVDTTAEIRLSSAPFLEGIVAGIVLAAAGASLDDADREASAAMNAKNAQLGPPVERESAASAPAPNDGAVVVEVTLVNPFGLHARPAAAIVGAVSEFDSTVTIASSNSERGPVSAKSLMGIMALGAQLGDTLRIEATGSQGAEAAEKIRAMTADGFGELDR
ncbi:MAG: HPr family phosphocarrier protein [Microbacteriaceae bacterium]|nr:HPr family phosphocarrier protein [Microbacteriaceae bacterium]